MNITTKFEETQPFSSNSIIWIVFSIVLGVVLFRLYQQYPQVHPPLFIPLCILLLTFVWLFLLKLVTTIDESGIHFYFTHLPFAYNHFKWEEVKLVQVITYNPWLTGFGLRHFSAWGTVYNVKGKQGLQIILNSGKTYLLGTQRPEELQATLKELRK